MMKIANLQKGFTLIELILYISIVTIVLSALIPFAWNIIGNSAKSTTQQEVSSNARFVAERLKYEIRNATGIDTPNSNFSVNLANNSAQKITLTTSSGTTVINVLNGRIQLTQGGPTTPISSSNTTVSNLTFTNYTSSDQKTKHIGFTLDLQALSSSRVEFQSTISLRTSAEIRSN